jgi:hypothetical protein
MKREVLYPIFLRCVPFVGEDMFWRETFEDLAYGICYGGAYITKGVMCSKVKGKEFVYKFNDKEPERICTDVTRLLREKLNIMSKNERKAMIDEMMEADQHNAQLRNMEWNEIKKKSIKDILFQNFLIKMKYQYELRDSQMKKLYNIINLCLLLKSLKNTDIVYKNGEIQEIKGFHFSKSRYRVDLDIYSGLDEDGGKSVEKRDVRKLRYL